jgi:hypothetical protein
MDPMTPLAQPRTGRRGRPPVRLEEITLEWLGEKNQPQKISQKKVSQDQMFRQFMTIHDNS